MLYTLTRTVEADLKESMSSDQLRACTGETHNRRSRKSTFVSRKTSKASALTTGGNQEDEIVEDIGCI